MASMELDTDTVRSGCDAARRMSWLSRYQVILTNEASYLQGVVLSDAD